VGTTTSTRGWPVPGKEISFCSSGNRYAAVLPVPSRRSQNVATGQGIWDRRTLDGRGNLEAHSPQILLQAWVELKIIELHKLLQCGMDFDQVNSRGNTSDQSMLK